MEINLILSAALVGYFLGAIPFGLFISKLGGAGDIRHIGSGNIGATNVLRTGRKGLAALTLLLDGGKAAAAVLITALFIGSPYHLIAGAGALVGHCFPVWLGFKGGKGVATFFGILLAAYWPLGLIAAVIWLGIAYVFKMSSLAALVTAIAIPFTALAIGQYAIALMAAVLAVIIYIRHLANIRRIIGGTEPRIGGSSKKSARQ